MFGHHRQRRDEDPRGGRGCGPRGMRHGGERGFGRFEGGWGEHRRGHRGGPGGRGRPFEQGDLKFVVLDLIAAQPRHGYELIKAIEDALDGHYSPSPGVIYPTLTLLEETGLVSAETQGAKKLYTLTDEGRAWLDKEAEAVSAAKARMDEARSRFGPRPSAEIGRAMQNLASALGVRLARGPLSPEETHAVVDAIDTAARAVERS